MQKLLRQGKSYSGRERNCCFLNPGGSSDPSRTRFATVSACTSLDFPDDSRGQATCDWDHDGRLDLWITNRTGPRVRLLLNRYRAGENRSVSLRLHGNGKSVNRDAVGARLEVYLEGAETPLLRTVTAGTGFLSQSSLWQHVGTGAQKIEKVTVKWPGGEPETFTGVQAGGFFDLKQGAGSAAVWTAPDKPNVFSEAGPGAPPVHDDSEIARIVLLSALPVPESFLPAPPGKTGLLLNLWSSTCPHCLAELKDWGPKLKEWTAAGVKVVSWCVDADGPAAEKAAQAQGFSVPVLTTGGSGQDAALTTVLDAVQKGCIGLQKDMPVPVSFLFDAKRRLVAIYKGPVNALQVKADFSLLTATDAQRRMAASPDKSGQWSDPIGAVGVKGPVVTLLEAGLAGEAEKLLLAAVDWYAPVLPKTATPAEQGWRLKELSSAHHALAGVALQRDDFTAAENRYLASIAAIPSTGTRRDLVRLYMSRKDKRLYPAMAAQLEAIVAVAPDPEDLAKLGVLLMETGRPSQAVAPLQRSTAARPDAMNFFQLGQALRASAKPAEAAQAWVKALELRPGLAPALNNLAWLRATNPTDSLRDGAAAVKLAAAAAAVAGPKQFIFQGTLSAALAEAGRFEEAVVEVEKAVKLADAAGQKEAAARFTGWKEKYLARQPVRDP